MTGTAKSRSSDSDLARQCERIAQRPPEFNLYVDSEVGVGPVGTHSPSLKLETLNQRGFLMRRHLNRSIKSNPDLEKIAKP